MKKRKRIVFVLLAFFVAAAGAGAYAVYLRQVSAASVSQEIVPEEEQELLYAKITSISGNEMAYVLLEEQVVDVMENENSRGQNKRASGDALSNDQNERTPDNASSDDAQSRTRTIYTETGVTGQIQIPVGTDVETKLGTITTFSRLSNGDTIRLLLQKTDDGSEELLKIWIVE